MKNLKTIWVLGIKKPPYLFRFFRRMEHHQQKMDHNRQAQQITRSNQTKITRRARKGKKPQNGKKNRGKNAGGLLLPNGMR